MDKLFRQDFVCCKCIHNKVCKHKDSGVELYQKANSSLKDSDNMEQPFMFNFICENYTKEMFRYK